MQKPIKRTFLQKIIHNIFFNRDLKLAKEISEITLSDIASNVLKLKDFNTNNTIGAIFKKKKDFSHFTREIEELYRFEFKDLDYSNIVFHEFSSKLVSEYHSSYNTEFIDKRTNFASCIPKSESYFEHGLEIPQFFIYGKFEKDDIIFTKNKFGLSSIKWHDSVGYQIYVNEKIIGSITEKAQFTSYIYSYQIFDRSFSFEKDMLKIKMTSFVNCKNWNFNNHFFGKLISSDEIESFDDIIVLIMEAHRYFRD